MRLVRCVVGYTSPFVAWIGLTFVSVSVLKMPDSPYDEICAPGWEWSTLSSKNIETIDQFKINKMVSKEALGHPEKAAAVIEELRSLVHNDERARAYLEKVPGAKHDLEYALKGLSFALDEFEESVSPPPTNIVTVTKLKEAIPDLRTLLPCPCTMEHSIKRRTLWNVIQHLNDDAKWSREQIADWLETLDLDINFNTGGSNEQD